MSEQKVGIACDPWKLPIFERHLSQAGYTLETIAPWHDSLLLTVKTSNPGALASVVRAANAEAATSKGAKP